MYEVHIYTSVSGRSPGKQKRSGFYRLETETGKGAAGLECTVELTETVNGAELQVLNEALKRIHKDCRIIIHTDSGYIAAGFLNGWVKRWQEAGWKNAKGKVPANCKKWQETLHLLVGRPFQVILNEKQGENAKKR